MPQQKLDKSKLTSKTILIGAVTNVFLSITKIFFGITSNSHALVADGVHSVSDLITDLVVYIAAKLGGHEADKEHPYGHRKIETLAITIIAVSLILVALGIIYDSLVSLFNDNKVVPDYIALIVSIISIILNEWLYRYTAKFADLFNMDILMANAWHHRSDAASSIVVSLGILGAILGFQYLDAIAAVVVGIMIIKMAIQLGWFSIKELIDTSIEESVLQNISKCILDTEGVVMLHQLRGRSMARDIILDVHIIVNPQISVSEGHFIGHQVKSNIFDKFNQVVDITVHIDPEDDELIDTNSNLKPRSEIMLDVKQYAKILPFFDKIINVNLHYLDGSIIIDVFFDSYIFEENNCLNDLLKVYTNELSKIDYVQKVNLYAICP